VFVCPQGIDIRNGFQLECIACARCIDACDIVMEKLGHRTLIQWTSVARARGARRRLRPRTVLYAGILSGLAAAAVLLMVARAPFDAAVQRAPGSLFTLDPDGYVRNTYLLRVTNKLASPDPVSFHVRVEGVPPEDVIVGDLSLATTESRTVPLVIRMKARPDLPRTIPIQVHVASPSRDMALDATFKTEGHLGTE